MFRFSFNALIVLGLGLTGCGQSNGSKHPRDDISGLTGTIFGNPLEILSLNFTADGEVVEDPDSIPLQDRITISYIAELSDVLPSDYSMNNRYILTSDTGRTLILENEPEIQSLLVAAFAPGTLQLIVEVLDSNRNIVDSSTLTWTLDQAASAGSSSASGSTPRGNGAIGIER